MSRRAGPHREESLRDGPSRLDLPNVPVGVRRRAPDPDARPAQAAPGDDVRFDELVAALLAPDGQSIAGLARSARYSTERPSGESLGLYPPTATLR